MKFGYARVSTHGQAKDGNSLEHQERLLKEEGCKVIFTDTHTGTKSDRPEFKNLLDVVKDGDTIVVTKLDRFARSTLEGSTIVKELIDRGVGIHILNLGKLDNSPTNKLMRTMFFAFAEFERDMIVERTQEGKALAKMNPDYKEGRPRVYGKKQIDHALELLNEHSYKTVEGMTGISKSTLIRAKRKLNQIKLMNVRGNEAGNVK